MFKKALGLNKWFVMFCIGFSSLANAAYPERPVRVVLPYAPGAAGDIVFRQLQPALAKELGQTVVVDYKSGAGGTIGGLDVARAAPDGYTLLLGATNNFVINQFLYPGMGYDPLKAFEPIAKIVDVPAFIYMNTKVPAKNFAEFSAYAKQHPGVLNYGTPGAGTTPALSGWMLSDAIGGKMEQITYRGSAPGVQALLANEIQVYIGGYSIASSFLGTGKVRALAVALPKRFSETPDVPTTAEVGVEKAVVSNWWGLAAPAGTDPAIIARLENAVKKVLADPELQQKLREQGFVAGNLSARQFKADLQKEAPYWQDIIKKAGVKLE